MSNRAMPPTVVIVLYDGIQLFDLAGPTEVFSLAVDPLGGQAYDVRFIAPGLNPIRASAGLSIVGEPAERTPAQVHTLLVPGAPGAALRRVLEDAAFMRWVAQTAARATRVVSVCSGAFVLAALGLLDGRRAATHWSAADRLAKAYPTVQVDREALFVEDGAVWTSAGISAGIDLALALVRREFGRDVAVAVAREMIVPLVRNGGQTQFSQPLELQAKAGPDLDRLIPWISDRLQEDVTVEAMAEAMCMSVRSFQRRCARVFGLPPAKLVTELRMERARSLLSDPAMPVSVVAGRSGFADGTTFSKAFAKRFNTTPTAYRHRLHHAAEAATASPDETGFNETGSPSGRRSTR